MKHNEWLQQEISAWQAEGIVDDKTADVLRERYPLPTRKHSLVAILAGCFGALLVGLGIISILAANWECLTRGIRACIAMTPLVICGALALTATLKSWKTPAFWEPLGIFWAIALAAAASLVAQTYQLGGSVPGLVLFIALLTLPVAWITGSMGVMMAWIAYPFVWFLAMLEFNEPESAWLGCRALALMALSLPAYITFLRRNPPRAVLLAAQIITGILFSQEVGWILGVSFNDCLANGWDLEFFVLMFWLSALLLGICAWRFKLPAWRLIAVLSASAAALCAPFCDLWLFALAILFAIGVTAYGIKYLKLSYTNIGACLLLWQILMKFFESDLDFTIKGIVLIACGIGLTVFNVFFVRFRKAQKEVANEQNA